MSISCLMPMRWTVAGVLVWLLCSNSGATSSFADDPAALALLKSVESARKTVVPFRVEGRLTVRGPEEFVRERTFVLEYDASRYRVSSRGGRKETVIFDGVRMLAFDGGNSATVSNMSRPAPEFAFDPRLLSLLPFYRPGFSLEDRLPYRTATSVEVTGSEVIHREMTSKVRLVDGLGQTATFWIQPHAPYRVHRYEIVVPSDDGGHLCRYVSDSQFDGSGADSWIPESVTIRFFGHKGLEPATETTTLELGKAVINVAFPATTWTLAGLGMGIGQPVADLSLKQRIGY